ncbi:zinc-dependent metalloprotease [Mucilaginibacter sp. RS28]|uniref:Zinc-dependent metalloprotease n=1 Tax=Mucilaginibacter straminoryzae TaxID=2932774 RepID=A0A9X1X405_9SPHI|nr:zinc-dependent metalloprotease [Mucilaginibacter straminoryzae]MCJ8209755.1 zinc-dependent metalloprotease [Mucilaginibacter straminoryzae]
MKKIFALGVCLTALSLTVNQVGAQNRTGKPAEQHANPPAMLPPLTSKAEPKPYKDIITAKAKTEKGLFIVHQVEDKTYFEIPDSILDRDILLVSRVAKAGADWRNTNTMTGYAGDQLSQSVIRFERTPNNKIFVREMSYNERSQDSTRAMYRAVTNSNVQPVVYAFDIKAFHPDTVSGRKNSVIDMSDVINGDVDLFYFGGNKQKFNISSYQSDKSYLIKVNTFPINTEIRTFKTYMRTAPTTTQSANGINTTSTPAGRPVSVELNTSLVLLPKVPMMPRYGDGRVGYFTTSYTDFDVDPQGVRRQNIIERWRLEPRKEDREKYNRGELVEPKTPIVIYIDPATPAKWVPFLMQGVNDWQAAFERAGFKNAIVAKKAPTYQEDPTWDIDDARHSAIIYKPSTVPNASGPHIVDPRSGEVIETHINWYHNVMKLVHDWYFVQAAAIDPKARKMEFDDELMGQLIRFVSSHEVGHTLGLLHNYGSSSATPVEKLRDKAWVEANGHTASIMDYARFNYVAQPEDGVGEKGIFPRIGEYDKWAIEWGYKLIPNAKVADDETTTLNKWIIAKAGDKRYWFGGEASEDDPRAQSEDLGDNAMIANTYGIKNLKRVMNHLTEWTRVPNEDYENLLSMHKEVYNQYLRYIGHVCKYIGGRYENDKSVEQPGAVYTAVPAGLQRQAMQFLNTQVFETPTWLIDKKILSLTGTAPTEIMDGLQTYSLAQLISQRRINRLLAQQVNDPKAYTANQFLRDLENNIWKELGTHSAISLFRRNLQKNYIDRLALVVRPPSNLPAGGTTDYVSLARASLQRIRSKIIAAKPQIHDEETRMHLEDVLSRINLALSSKV